MLQRCGKCWRYDTPFPWHFVCIYFFHKRALINFDQLLNLILHCRHYQVVMAEMLNPLYLTFPVLERLPFPRNLRFRKAVDHMYKVLEGATLQCRIHQHSWLLYRVSTRTLCCNVLYAFISSFRVTITWLVPSLLYFCTHVLYIH